MAARISVGMASLINSIRLTQISAKKNVKAGQISTRTGEAGHESERPLGR